MNHIALYEKQDPGKTPVSNCFIDQYMTQANEAQIKIYLYLLRSVSGKEQISVSSIADRFNYTERDILRALRYWDEQGLLTLEFDGDRNVKGICLNDAYQAGAGVKSADRGKQETLPASPEPPAPSGAVPVSLAPAETDPGSGPAGEMTGEGAQREQETRPFYSQEKLEEFQNREDVGGLFFMTEQYLGQPLSKADVSTVLYMYDHLRFGVDLIEFLIEYCVNAGHRNMRYIEATALAWHEKGIRDVEAARSEINVFHRDYYTVLRAFGLGGRNPVQADIDYIRRWRDDYGFDMELIIEAVNRTMQKISRPSFSYADGILKSWRRSSVRTKADVEALDEKRRKEEASGRRKPVPQIPADDKFRNFSERSYDFDELRKQFAKN